MTSNYLKHSNTQMDHCYYAHTTQEFHQNCFKLTLKSNKKLHIKGDSPKQTKGPQSKAKTLKTNHRQRRSCHHWSKHIPPPTKTKPRTTNRQHRGQQEWGTGLTVSSKDHTSQSRNGPPSPNGKPLTRARMTNPHH